jgi:hypothetical protein
MLGGAGLEAGGSNPCPGFGGLKQASIRGIPMAPATSTTARHKCRRNQSVADYRTLLVPLLVVRPDCLLSPTIGPPTVKEQIAIDDDKSTTKLSLISEFHNLGTNHCLILEPLQCIVQGILNRI